MEKNINFNNVTWGRCIWDTRTVLSLLEKLYLKNSDAISVVSSAIEKDVKIKKNISIRSMGVDAQNLFVPAATSERKDILFVGRLVDKKGCDILLKAFSILIKSENKINLNIIGSGPEQKSLEKLTRELGIESSVKFLGALNQINLVKWYQSSKIFIMPSVVAKSGDQEGLGLVAAEAMACECPVVASNLPAVRDLIDDKIDGILVPPSDEKELANALKRIFEQL